MNNDIAKVRRESLKRLIDQYNGPTALAKRLGNVGASYLSQLASGKKPFTEKTARKIEKGLGLPQWALDADVGAPLPFSGTDHSLIAAVVRAVGESLEKAKIQPGSTKFAELVAMVYEKAAQAGHIDLAYVQRLIQLLK